MAIQKHVQQDFDRTQIVIYYHHILFIVNNSSSITAFLIKPL